MSANATINRPADPTTYRHCACRPGAPCQCIPYVGDTTGIAGMYPAQFRGLAGDEPPTAKKGSALWPALCILSILGGAYWIDRIGMKERARQVRRNRRAKTR